MRPNVGKLRRRARPKGPEEIRRYYLQYAAPGTDWKAYGIGVYTGKKPLGPFH